MIAKRRKCIRPREVQMKEMSIKKEETGQEIVHNGDDDFEEEYDESKTNLPFLGIREVGKMLAGKLKPLRLSLHRVEEFLVIQRKKFDFRVNESPFHAQQILFNFSTGRFHLRLWNITYSSGILDKITQLENLCIGFFFHSIPCLGLNEALRKDEEDEYEILNYPFVRKVSKKCLKLYKLDSNKTTTKLTPNETVGIGLCRFCRKKQNGDDEKCGPTFAPGDLETSFRVKIDSSELGEESPLRGRLVNEVSEQFLAECQTNFDSELETKKHHLKDNHGTFPCDTCSDFRTNDPGDLFDHLIISHKREEYFNCPHCQIENFPSNSYSKDDFLMHYRICTKIKIENDSKYEKSKRSRKVEVECNDIIIRPHRCMEPGCHFRSSYPSQLKVHVAIKHNPIESDVIKKKNLYECEKCDKRYPSKAKLQEHQLRDHEGMKIEYPCSVCLSVFPTRHQLFKHKNLEHRKDDALCCKKCHYRCGSLYMLKRHIVSHDAPTLICKFCGKLLKSGQSLKAHEFTHTGEKPYECNYCDYKCKAHSVLRKHKLSKHKEQVKEEQDKKDTINLINQQT